MAHFAQLDENNIVIQVIVISNDDITDENNSENEQLGISLCKQLIGDANSIWKQTSYNSNFRKNYARIGGKYLDEYDCFIEAQPYESWILNTETLIWDPPVPYPENYSELTHIWNEDELRWES